MTAELKAGDCLERMREMSDASMDAVVTDPPYELGFMGKLWDASGIAYSVELWREVLRVLKPGGHLLAFGGTRTYHRMAVAIEDAGFEIRDSLHWIYGTGFPKSLDVSKALDKAAGAKREVVGPNKWADINGAANLNTYGAASRPPQTVAATDAARQWDGWGTALKPAHEPVVVARKPLVGTVAANVLAHGTGALNIDGCRVAIEAGDNIFAKNPHTVGTIGNDGIYGAGKPTEYKVPSGRWPPNILLSHTPECVFVGTKRVKTATNNGSISRPGVNVYDNYAGDRPAFDYADADGMEEVEAWECAEGCAVAEMDRQGDNASRFFPVFRYQAKASRSERGVGNVHPTVKPVELMRWLVRLVTPPGGVVLDPFMGSGTTGVACVKENVSFVGIEREPQYLEICKARVEAARGMAQGGLFE